jgi:hypothetical protein
MAGDPAHTGCVLPDRSQPALRHCAAATRHWLPIVLGGALLLWPAGLNGYPIVFSDTGTYLSQAVGRYLGWDRPPFYSVAILPLHMTLTLWPVVLAQALLAAHTLHLVRRTLLPQWNGWSLVPLLGVLAGLTWLPWLASEVMPDLFTPLLVLALSLLTLAADRLTPGEQVWLVGLSAFMIAAQQSSLGLAAILLAVLPALRWPVGWGGWLRALLPLALAVTALVGVNLMGHGRLSVSPFGNTFLLARVIYDGPGMAVLRRDCPASGWRLCGVLDRLPPTSDEFLWSADSPIPAAGGHKAVSADADAIIAAAVTAQPWVELRAFLANSLEQLGRFDSGDGLEPWPDAVSPRIVSEFPTREQAAYAAARQTRGETLLPPWLRDLHRGVALAGVALCLMLLPGAVRRREPAAGFMVAVLVSLVAGAAITGGLSAPHDRYQSRLMWLPPCIGLLALARRLSPQDVA